MSEKREGLTTQQVTRMTGLTRRQLQYWRGTGLLIPALTPGGHGRYSAADLRYLRLMRVLRDNSVSIQQMRGLLPALSAHINAMLDEREKTG